jgi:response regulator RpfG family c-di-GMP phosphodiesterase
MKILIIDDVQFNITLLQHLIKKLPGSEAISFTEPLKAIVWCENNEPDLVIVDYMMPGMDGIMFSKEFRKLYPDIPILMVTANHESAVLIDALANGVTDFLNKPLDNAEFLARVKNMLALRKNMLALRENYMLLADRAALLAHEVEKATAEIVAREQETIFCLAKAAEYRDPETGSHIHRMAHYSKHIAGQLGLPAEQQHLLLESAPMHDIGKVGTPDMILLKPGRLTTEEFAIMKHHAVIGYEILNASKSPLLKLAAEIAYTHHERFDGSGYPRGLAGEAIPIFARIVAVADVFDALTSERPYKKAWETEKALQFLQEGSGTHFDPDCVAAFSRQWDEVLAIKNQFVDEILEVRDRTLDY